MEENQKVYVKAKYVGESLEKVEIISDSMLFNFTSDFTWYQKETNAFFLSRVKYSDKIIVEVRGTNVVYELFICNFNEIINYLH